MTAHLYLQIVYVLVWHTLTTSVATTSFTSTPAHVGGVLKVCVGDQISLTCSHDDIMGNGQTRWLFSPPVDCDVLIDHFQPNTAQPCGPFTFRDVSETTGGIVLNSTVVVTANTSISGAVAECRDASGTSYNEIGRTSICVIDQPTNLTVVDGTQVYWNGTVCADSETTYRVMVTLVSDSQPTGDPIETSRSNTMTVLSGLLPNQEYTVSVSAYGASCVSNPATVNFTSPAHRSTTITTGETGDEASTTTEFPEQKTEECDRSSGGEVGLAVGVVVGVGLPFQVIIIAVTVVATLIINNYCLRHRCNGQLDGAENDDRLGPGSQEERRVSPHKTLHLPTDRQEQGDESAFYEEIVPTDSSTIDLHNNDPYSVV